MSLHSIISALLPAAYREQVLGDLEERGFRAADIASVLPRIWASHVLRSVTGRPPRVTLASEAAIIVRTQQLWNLGRLAGSVALGIAALARSATLPVSTGSRVGIVFGSWILFGALTYFGHSGSEPPLSLNSSRAKRLADYRQQSAFCGRRCFCYPCSC